MRRLPRLALRTLPAGVLLAGLGSAAAAAPPAAKLAHDASQGGAPADGKAPAAVSLEEIERRALERHPAVAQAAAAQREAEGERRQTGLYPNPTIGYLAEEVPLEDDRDGGRYGVFVAQEIVLGGKRRLDREIGGFEMEAAEAELEIERQSVVNTARALYYRSVAAQRLLELGRRMAGLAAEAVEITDQLHNTGAADRADQLAVEIEERVAWLAAEEAERSLRELWLHLQSAVGDPTLTPQPLADTLEEIPELAAEEWLARIVAESPEVRRAQALAGRAERSLARARRQPLPNLDLRASLADNQERESPGGPRIGSELSFEAGIRLPIFDRNQGAGAAAAARLDGAEREVERVRLSLQSRFAPAYFQYRQAYETARAYRDGILDAAREAHRLYLDRYRQAMAAYPQVLLAQRELLRAEATYVEALARAQEAAVAIQGFLVPAEPSAQEVGISPTAGHLGEGTR